jgi:hypothetical protein
MHHTKLNPFRKGGAGGRDRGKSVSNDNSPTSPIRGGGGGAGGQPVIIEPSSVTTTTSNSNPRESLSAGSPPLSHAPTTSGGSFSTRLSGLFSHLSTSTTDLSLPHQLLSNTLSTPSKASSTASSSSGGGGGTSGAGRYAQAMLNAAKTGKAVMDKIQRSRSTAMRSSTGARTTSG